MGEPVDARTGDAGQRPGELGEGDEYVTDGDVGAQTPRGHGALDEPFDGLFEATALGEQFGMVLVEAAGQHRAQRADPFVGRRVHEAAERGERVGLPVAASSARSVVRQVTASTTSWVSAARSGKFR